MSRVRLRHRLPLPLLAACVASAVLAYDARADDFDAKLADRGYELELGAKAGYVSPPTAGYVSPFGVGLGARLGASFSGIYVGFSLVDFLGGTQGTISEHSLLYGAEVGYGIRIHDVGGGSITFRPQIGIGLVSISRTDSSQVDVVTTASGLTGTSAKSTTVSNVYLEPGLAVIYANGPHFFAIHAGSMIVPGLTYDQNGSQTWVTYGARAELGFRF